MAYNTPLPPAFFHCHRPQHSITISPHNKHKTDRQPANQPTKTTMRFTTITLIFMAATSAMGAAVYPSESEHDRCMRECQLAFQEKECSRKWYYHMKKYVPHAALP